jgi:uncharacterized protein DUF4129
MNQRPVSTSAGNKRAFRFVSYGLVFLLMACVLMALGALMQNVLSGWHAGIITGLLLFIVIDRLYTYGQLKSMTPLGREWVTAHAAQWIGIALLIRFLLAYVNGLDSFLRDLSGFARGDLVRFFSPEFIITFLLALLIWGLTAQFLALLDEIGLDVEVALHDDPGPIQMDIIPAHQRLVNLILSLGIGLVILTALTRLNFRATFSTTVGIPSLEWNRFSGAEAGALLYFVFGLALLSLSRLMSLQTHWGRLRIPVTSDNLTRQWGIYSLLLLFLLAVVVSLLPAGDSFGFFSVLETLFGFLIGIFVFLSQLVITIVILLLSLLMLMLGKAPPLRGGSLPPLFPTLPTEPVVPPDSSAFLALLRSILLWGSLLAIIVFAFIHFVRQHDSILAGLRRSRITNWLILAWQWLYRNAEQTGANLSRAIIDGWQSIVARLEAKRLLTRPGFLSVRSLDPRRRIYFFYLAMIRRGGDQGVARKPSQTPAEFAVQLEKAVPEAGDDIDSLTQAFIEARYSRQEVDSGKADRVKAIWDRIRRALQNKSKSN